jgi:hypothetical protein
MLTDAREALLKGQGAGWNICVGQPETWSNEIKELLDQAADEEIDRRWREAMAPNGGAFVISAPTCAERVREVAIGWAAEHAQTVSRPSLESVNTRELYARLHDGSEGREWLTSVAVAPVLSPIHVESSAADDTWIPRIDAGSIWVVYAD